MFDISTLWPTVPNLKSDRGRQEDIGWGRNPRTTGQGKNPRAILAETVIRELLAEAEIRELLPENKIRELLAETEIWELLADTEIRELFAESETEILEDIGGDRTRELFLKEGNKFRFFQLWKYTKMFKCFIDRFSFWTVILQT